ncbi:MAG: TraR/DksA family transcriptional regulator [Parcubacteria group bacterium]|nr:TraR/DksA family transcriptional regulator [Parcubacteria group bacterium]
MVHKPLDQSFIEEQKRALLEKKEQLEQDLAARGAKKGSDAADYRAAYQEYGDDEESNAAEYAQTETNLGVVEELEDELAKTCAALERIEHGTYGIDAATGKPIRMERLRANPAALTDIAP